MVSPITPEVQISLRAFKAIKNIADRNKEGHFLSKLEANDISISAAKAKIPEYFSEAT